jgi:hypothetical protein
VCVCVCVCVCVLICGAFGPSLGREAWEKAFDPVPERKTGKAAKPPGGKL